MGLAPPQLSCDRPIPVHLAGDKAYVYDIDSIRKLRVDHHITGITLGTLPQVAQQNVFLGVPLQLLPEEVAVLVEQRIASLVDDKLAHIQATPEEAHAYAKARKQAIVRQQDLQLQQDEEKTRLMQQKYRDQIEKKQKEKREKKQKQQEAVVASKPDEESGGLLQPDDAAEQQSIIVSSNSKALQADNATKKTDSSHVPYSIVTPTTSAGRTWYNPRPLSGKVNPNFPDASILFHQQTARSTFSLLDAHGHIDAGQSISPLQGALNDITKLGRGGTLGAVPWSDGSGAVASPTADSEMAKLKQARIRVFKDLWMKGYFIGSGLKFGADFLVYPGDPLRFHSHFVCTVLANPLSDVTPLDIVAWGRLATAVKKAHLIASWDEGRNKVEYLSLEWAGFG